MYEAQPDDWLVEVVGEKLDIKGVLELVPAYFVEIESKVFLAPHLFAAMDRPNAVREKAQGIVDTLNGLATTRWGDSNPVQMRGPDRYRDDGGRNISIHGRIAGNVRIRGFSPTVTCGEEPDNPAEPLSQRGADLALTNPVVAKVLRMLGRRPITLITLYNVVEAIEGERGFNISDLDGISARQRTRFRRTVNSETVSGDKARHGHQKTTPPPNPMSDEEATRMVRKIVDLWLEQLCPSP